MLIIKKIIRRMVIKNYGGRIVEKNYYAQKLNSEKLYQVYQTQLERVKQYIDADMNFVRHAWSYP
jgi:hypothetical protein